jgi:hypothetical protein
MSEEKNLPAEQAAIPPEEIPQEQPVNKEPIVETNSSHKSIAEEQPTTIKH